MINGSRYGILRLQGFTCFFSPLFCRCRDTTDCITNNLMLVCRHPFDGWMDHTFHGEFLWSTSGFGEKNTFGVEKTPETISMENTGTTRNLSEVFFSQEIWFWNVLSDFSRELFLQLGCWRTRPKFWLFCRIGQGVEGKACGNPLVLGDSLPFSQHE